MDLRNAMKMVDQYIDTFHRTFTNLSISFKHLDKDSLFHI